MTSSTHKKKRKPRVRKDDFITLPEAAARGFGQADTLKRRCQRGKLPCRKSGQTWLVRLSALQQQRLWNNTHLN